MADSFKQLAWEVHRLLVNNDLWDDWWRRLSEWEKRHLNARATYIKWWWENPPARSDTETGWVELSPPSPDDEPEAPPGLLDWRDRALSLDEQIFLLAVIHDAFTDGVRKVHPAEDKSSTWQLTEQQVRRAMREDETTLSTIQAFLCEVEHATADWLVRQRETALRDAASEKSNGQSVVRDAATEARDKPHWNGDTGELTIGGKLAKTIRYLRQAKNVVRILTEFTECDWPERIDDPLPGGRDTERLKNTLDSLNRNLSLIRFSGDGTGEGIRWGHVK